MTRRSGETWQVVLAIGVALSTVGGVAVALLAYGDRVGAGPVLAIAATVLTGATTALKYVWDRKASAEEERLAQLRDEAVNSILSSDRKAKTDASNAARAADLHGAAIALHTKRLEDELADAERASRLQETAIALHTQRLQGELARLRWRAMFAFAPGVLLCLSSLIAPYVGYLLATEQKEWKYFIGGSTLAAILLGAGSALLRHDNKVREQVQWFQTEVLYFSRVKTGLDCALAISPDEHAKGLRAVIEHLLAPPPSLGFRHERDEEPRRRRPRESDGESAIGALKAATEAVMKKVAGESSGGHGTHESG